LDLALSSKYRPEIVWNEHALKVQNPHVNLDSLAKAHGFTSNLNEWINQVQRTKSPWTPLEFINGEPRVQLFNATTTIAQAVSVASRVNHIVKGGWLFPSQKRFVKEIEENLERVGKYSNLLKNGEICMHATLLSLIFVMVTIE
jgi:hypothetical protein